MQYSHHICDKLHCLVVCNNMIAIVKLKNHATVESHAVKKGSGPSIV
jgi:hypothetical protein